MGPLLLAPPSAKASSHRTVLAPSHQLDFTRERGKIVFLPVCATIYLHQLITSQKAYIYQNGGRYYQSNQVLIGGKPIPLLEVPGSALEFIGCHRTLTIIRLSVKTVSWSRHPISFWEREEMKMSNRDSDTLKKRYLHAQLYLQIDTEKLGQEMTR